MSLLYMLSHRNAAALVPHLVFAHANGFGSTPVLDISSITRSWQLRGVASVRVSVTGLLDFIRNCLVAILPRGGPQVSACAFMAPCTAS